MRKLVIAAALALAAGPALAVNVEGVNVPDRVTVGDQSLVLNGAGVRKKLWVEVYVGALYLPSKTASAQQAIGMEGPKRIHMFMLYDVSRKKLVSAWEDGFENNSSKDELRALESRMETFYSYWRDTEEGDQIVLDYVPGEGTTVTFQGVEMGTIQGADFSKALFSIWLGDESADDDLKEGMLGQD